MPSPRLRRTGRRRPPSGRGRWSLSGCRCPLRPSWTTNPQTSYTQSGESSLSNRTPAPMGVRYRGACEQETIREGPARPTRSICCWSEAYRGRRQRATAEIDSSPLDTRPSVASATHSRAEILRAVIKTPRRPWSLNELLTPALHTVALSTRYIYIPVQGFTVMFAEINIKPSVSVVSVSQLNTHVNCPLILADDTCVRYSYS